MADRSNDPPEPDASLGRAEATKPAAGQATAPRLLVVVCTYNEQLNLPSLIDEIHAVLPTAEVLVVDDDSPDGTGRWAQQQAAANGWMHALIRTNERGLGSALRAGIQFAIARDFNFVLNLDGDHSHRPRDLPRLLEKATSVEPPLDVVVGSRYLPGGGIEGWPLRRLMMSRTVNRFATSFLRLPVSDCSGALRCYRVEALRRLDWEAIRCNGYAIMEELLIALQRNGARFGEIPITFVDRRKGNSKLTFAESLRSAKALLRMMTR